MASPYWIKTFINHTFSQRFLLSKLSRYPVIGTLIRHLLFEGDEIFYILQDKVIPVNKTLSQKEDLVTPSEVLEHFIREANFHWIMDFCICRDSTKCEDYPRELGCIFLGKAAMDINPKFGRKVTPEEALEHAKRCREAGLVHLIGRNKLDTVWLNVGPGRNLLTICNCCPCCCLWKVLPEITPEISSKINRMPGVVISVTDQCVGCGKCTLDICFVDAIMIENERAVIKDHCRGCGRCVSICKNNAIEIKIENDEFVTDTIKRISNVVDVK
ncbi:4Fe-4S binding protein [Desulfobacterales bacterium HSG16]|nr:4Fe-4S binding protein [Desulfobacterales bacterium HSG16]